jgi:hypothetical protein
MITQFAFRLVNVIGLISFQELSQIFRARDGLARHAVKAHDWFDRSATVQITGEFTVGVAVFNPRLLRRFQGSLITLVISDFGGKLLVDFIQFIVGLLVLFAGAGAHFDCRLRVGTGILRFLWLRENIQ